MIRSTLDGSTPTIKKVASTKPSGITSNKKKVSHPIAKLSKGYLKNLATGEKIPYLYNPETFNTKQSLKYATISSVAGNYPKIAYVGADWENLSVEIFVHDPEGKKSESYIKAIERLKPSKTGKNFSPPPFVLFSYGPYCVKVIVEDFDITRQEFTPDLKVTQASVNLSMKVVV
jgi:hypothetical protein